MIGNINLTIKTQRYASMEWINVTKQLIIQLTSNFSSGNRANIFTFKRWRHRRSPKPVVRFAYIRWRKYRWFGVEWQELCHASRCCDRGSCLDHRSTHQTVSSLQMLYRYRLGSTDAFGISESSLWCVSSSTQRVCLATVCDMPLLTRLKSDYGMDNQWDPLFHTRCNGM